MVTERSAGAQASIPLCGELNLWVQGTEVISVYWICGWETGMWLQKGGEGGEERGRHRRQPQERLRQKFEQETSLPVGVGGTC